MVLYFVCLYLRRLGKQIKLHTRPSSQSISKHTYLDFVHNSSGDPFIMAFPILTPLASSLQSSVCDLSWWSNRPASPLNKSNKPYFPHRSLGIVFVSLIKSIPLPDLRDRKRPRLTSQTSTNDTQNCELGPRSAHNLLISQPHCDKQRKSNPKFGTRVKWVSVLD